MGAFHHYPSHKLYETFTHSSKYCTWVVMYVTRCNVYTHDIITRVSDITMLHTLINTFFKCCNVSHEWDIGVNNSIQPYSFCMINVVYVLPSVACAVQDYVLYSWMYVLSCMWYGCLPKRFGVFLTHRNIPQYLVWS